MSQHDALRPLASRDAEPLFTEAWQAQALAMSDTLVRAGMFSADDWASALGQAVRAHDDTQEGYYLAVLSALEGLIDAHGVPNASVQARRDAWADAYRRTPHGAPVEL